MKFIVKVVIFLILCFFSYGAYINSKYDKQLENLVNMNFFPGESIYNISPRLANTNFICDDRNYKAKIICKRLTDGFMSREYDVIEVKVNSEKIEKKQKYFFQ